MKRKDALGTDIEPLQMPPELKSSGIDAGGDSLPLKRKKRATRRTLKVRAWQTFSRFIRLRDCLFTTGTKEYGKCITCGVTFPFNRLHAGHFIPGRHNSNLFSEEGCHAQCLGCNIWKNGAPLQYRRAILDLYGDEYDIVLEKEARQNKKYSTSELVDLIKYYEEEVARMGERK